MPELETELAEMILKPAPDDAYTKASRKSKFEQSQSTAIKPEEKDVAQVATVSSVFRADGTIRQCNEGKWPFKLQEQPSRITLDLDLPKYLLTSEIDLNIEPTYIRCVVRERKVFQLILPHEVTLNGCVIQRARTTGVLHVEMPRLRSQTCTFSSTDSGISEDTSSSACLLQNTPTTNRGTDCTRKAPDEPPPLEDVENLEVF
eukprot:Filipodium_phascolosomae@DN2525_c0_g1_i1.p1